MVKRKLDSENDIVDTLVKKQKLADTRWPDEKTPESAKLDDDFKWPDEMTPEAAKRIEMLEEKWRKQSIENRRREAEEYNKRFRVPIQMPGKRKNQMMLLPPRDNTPLSVEEARRLDKLEDKLKADSEEQRRREIAEKRKIERQHEPVVDAIRKLTEELKKKDQEIRELRSKQNKPVLFRPRAMSTPSRKVFDKSTVVQPTTIEQDVFDKHEQVQPENIPEQEDVFDAETIVQAAKTPLPEDDDGDLRLDKSIQAMVETSGTEVGTLARQYLSKANDGTFGLNYDIGERKLKVGNSGITIADDDIIIDKTNERFTGTPGLWRLLTQSGDIGSEQYTKSDRDAYKQILIDSGAIYQSNDPSSGRPKSSQGYKWKKLVKPMWEELRSGNPSGTGLLQTKRKHDRVRAMGSGLLIETNAPIEYKYIRKYADLVKRLYFLNAEERAGNNNFHNEKMGIVKFIYDRLMELTEKSKGYKYITRCMLVLPKAYTKLLIDRLELTAKDGIPEYHKRDVVEFIRGTLEKLIDLPDSPMYLARCLSVLPERVIKGSGILNDIINNLPFELHAPGMNFLGPGTKLQERLARGDKGVNPLDEAAKEHDIWYSKHKKTEDRWKADKVLQDKAFDRVLAPDASLYERPLALATGTAMWAKRKLGMGLDEPASLTGQDDAEKRTLDQKPAFKPLIPPYYPPIRTLKLGLASDRRKYIRTFIR